MLLFVVLLTGALSLPALAQDAPAPDDSAVLEAVAEVPEEAGGEAKELSALAKVLAAIDGFFGKLVEVIAPIIFFPIGGENGIPLIILILVLGGIFFTIRYSFINITLIKHSFDAIRGKYDDPDEVGEISHFKALTSALAATVGLGNIAGVAVAISLGGPGAVFWMWTTAFFGMSMKFSSCALAQTYRRVHPDGHVMGGPMVYLRDAMREHFPGGGWVIGVIFSYMYAVIIIFAAFAAGNMFQGNQTYSVIAYVSGLDADNAAMQLGTGLVMAALVGIVIIGGIKRIGEVTSKLVPLMCVFYVIVCGIIVAANYGEVPALIASIVRQAFSPEAMYGGFIGVLVQGMKRAAFSNEAGLGSASIAQAAAKTNEPIRAASVAMLGPVIDTMVVCTMTAFAILITGTHLEDAEGVEITAAAFKTVWVHMPIFLAVAVFVFAYSTMISWSYYGERAVEFLFGKPGILPYRICYVLVVILGPILSLSNVIDFADLIFLSLAIPNILGMALLSGKVRAMMKDYVGRLRSGEMTMTK